MPFVIICNKQKVSYIKMVIINSLLADIYYRLIIQDRRYEKKFVKNFSATSKNQPPVFEIQVKRSKKIKYFLFKAISNSKGVVYLGEGDRFFGFRDINFYLKGFIQFFTLFNNIFFLHGSSFILKNKAHVFLGPSGAGKSTIINFVKPHQILADDVVVVKKMNNDFFVYPSPFDKEKLPIIYMKHVKLGKIYILKKSVNVKIKPCATNEAENHIKEANFLYKFLKSRAKIKGLKVPIRIEGAILNLTKSLTTKTPIYKLYFRKDKKFLYLIKKS